jgi:hypothetical protein
MSRFRYSAVFAVVLGFCAQSAPSSAAQFEIRFTERCGVHMNGEIVDGDVERLQQAIDKAEQEEQAIRDRNPKAVNFPDDICFDSPGGSLSAASKVIDYLMTNNRIGTVIDKGATCAGACAYVFMAGRSTFENLTFPRRWLHVAGTLAFQRPETTGSAQSSAEALQRSYQEAVRTLSALAKHNGSHKEGSWRDAAFPYPRSLVAEVVKAGPGQPLVVDTLEQAHKWQIALFGVRFPGEPTRRHLHRACVAEAADRTDLGVGKAAEQSVADEVVAIAPGKTVRTVFNGFGAKAADVCVIDLYRSPISGLHVNVAFGKSVKNATQYTGIDFLSKVVDDRDGKDDNTPIWRTLPMATTIASLAAH